MNEPRQRLSIDDSAGGSVVGVMTAFPCAAALCSHTAASVELRAVPIMSLAD